MTDQKDHAEIFGEALCDGLRKIVESERYKKSKRGFLDDLWDDLQYSIIDQMPDAMQSLVQRMADDAVEAMLKGQPDQVRRYLKLDGWTGRDRDHPVIHGKLHENHVMALRRQVAEANEALLRDERIIDLQDQVQSLVAQVNKLEATNEQLWQRLCEARL